MTDDPQDAPRFLLTKIVEALETSRVVALVGARQTGKTSLARRFETLERPFVTLDDFGPLSQATADPQGFVRALAPVAIVDEIQRAPKLLLAIKAAVDRSRAKGQFLITGSADLMALPALSDSLAGRMTMLELFPLAQAEIENRPCNVADSLFEPTHRWRADPTTPQDAIRRVVRGGYPEAVYARDAKARDRWLASYLGAMIQRDVRDIADITDASAIARLLALIAARSARTVNFTSLGSDAGIAKTTLLRYISVLEQLFLIHRMPAWSLDLGRRLTKAPKLFVTDSGVAAHLMHADAARLIADRNAFGGLLETFVASELRKHASWSERQISIYHYREQSGVEVDFLLESSSGESAAVEVKGTASPTSGDASRLLKLMDDPKLGLVRGIVLHTGSDIVPIRENVHGVPLSVFWTAASSTTAT